MSWQDVSLKIDAPHHSHMTSVPVVAQSIASSARMRPRISITLRPEFIGPEAEWIKPGASFRLLIGSGEHLGLLRVEKGSGRVFAAAGGKQKPKRSLIILQGLDWIPADRHTMTALDHDSGEGWLEITLPAWGRPSATEAHADARSAPTQQVTPKRGISFVDQVADPVAARRRGQAPIGTIAHGR